MHLFEFNDAPWLPWPIRKTLFETMEMCNTYFRRFDREVAQQAIALATHHNLTTIVEMGAGHAPVTRALLELEESDQLHLVPCDLIPQTKTYAALAEAHPKRVFPRYDSIDSTTQHTWPPGTLLVVASAFHHVPPPSRESALATLTASADRVAVFEPIQRSLPSMLLTLTSIVPCLLLPIVLIKRPGRLRRIVCCWLFPIVPLMFLWDALVSCNRCWNEATWRSTRENIAIARPASIENRLHFQSETR